MMAISILVDARVIGGRIEMDKMHKSRRQVE